MNPAQTQDDVSARPTAGQMLRAAREARGLHLGVLSVNLKVSVRQLEALEADQHDILKGATFVRALAQAVCRQLGMDPAPVLAALPRAVQRQAIEPAALQSMRPATQPVRRQRTAKALPRTVWLLALLMLVGSAALIWWPGQRDAEPTQLEISDPSQAAVPMGQSSDPPQVTEEVPAHTQTQTPPAVPAMPVPSEASAPRPVAAPLTPAAVAVPVASLSSRATTPPAVAGSPASETPLVIRVTADAWVEVRDSNGQMAVRRVVKAGEALQLAPPPPLFVYLGRADSAELQWRGQTVDLKPHTQNNEARLQIKP